MKHSSRKYDVIVNLAFVSLGMLANYYLYDIRKNMDSLADGQLANRSDIAEVRGDVKLLRSQHSDLKDRVDDHQHRDNARHHLHPK